MGEHAAQLVNAEPTLAHDAFTGRKLGKYEIACRLSTGGMSEVFLALQSGAQGFSKYVVLKRILENIRSQPDVVRMFVQEAKITAGFSHSNIAQVFDLDEANGELFLAMEFIAGATLVEIAKGCIDAQEPIPTGLTLKVAWDTALALHYAHTFIDAAGRSQPVIHRDVAEKNIMVTYEGTTKLLDFGIAKRLDVAGKTQIGTVKGTSGYMSPEQIRGEPVDARSDVFSLGVVLHECLSGQRLFYRRSREEEMYAALHQDVHPPSRRNPEVTPALDAVVLRSLARNKIERFATARDFARAIELAAGPLKWEQDQVATFMQRMFANRRRKTREFLSDLKPYEEARSSVWGPLNVNSIKAPPRGETMALGGHASRPEAGGHDAPTHIAREIDLDDLQTRRISAPDEVLNARPRAGARKTDSDSVSSNSSDSAAPQGRVDETVHLDALAPGEGAKGPDMLLLLRTPTGMMATGLALGLLLASLVALWLS